MIIPDTIEISLVNKQNVLLPISNVFFGLKIYSVKGDHHSFSILATDSNGIIFLKRDEILENTGLQSDGLSDEPTPFEFYIWEQNRLQLFVKRLKLILDQYIEPNSLKRKLKTQGMTDSEILIELKKAKDQEKSDRHLMERLSHSQNKNLILFEDKVSGLWESSMSKKYNLMVKLKSTSK